MCDNSLLVLPVVKAKSGANNMQVHPLRPVPFIDLTPFLAAEIQDCLVGYECAIPLDGQFRPNVMIEYVKNVLSSGKNCFVYV